jgi:AraC-like DNA-binding protein
MKQPAPKSNLQREFGLRCWHGSPAVMAAAHRHNDVEINFVERGSVVYLFAGHRIAVECGQVLAFWAAAPHQMVDAATDTHMHWLTLPLAWLLQRQLPEGLSRALLRGRPVLGNMQPADAHIVAVWQHDLKEGGECRSIMMLEVEARMRRLALNMTAAPARTAPATHSASRHKAEAMARTIAHRFGEPLSIDDIAATVRLHPNYAMNLFRREFGLTINEYLTQQRVAHAQRLLITTDDDVLDVAMHAGFGSSSQFYAAFMRVCGQSPSAYRSAIKRECD